MQYKCYFECVVDGPIHRFPGWTDLKAERFNQWKSILSEKTQAKGNQYIYNNIHLCYRHFEEKYQLPSKRLTRNAIPTINIASLETFYVSQPSTSLSQPTPNVAVFSTRRIKETHIAKLKIKLKRITLMYKNLLLKERTKTSIDIFLHLQKIIKRRHCFTNEEKIMALALFKQSPKGYKLLEQLFVMPSKETLERLTSTFTLTPGINKNVLKTLEENIKDLPDEKKLVTVLFDEVSLAPGVIFNKALNEIIGFEDNGFIKNHKLADHALVFMLKGVKSNIQQPICFTFCHGVINKDKLKILLTKVIEEVNSTGFKVVATVCNQFPTNVKVIKDLNAETNRQYAAQTEAIIINNNKVFPLFDPPHLLKGVRNNLLKKDIKFIENGKLKIAKWEHLVMLFNADKGDDEIRLVNTLRKEHVEKDKIKKMKVRLAAQVFSQRVSSALRFLAKYGILSAECGDTADFLLLFEKLFDSFNGNSYQIEAKIYKSCIKNNSPHFKLWDDCMPVLESIKFISVITRGGTSQTKYESIPSINNWIHNIKTFKEMWTYLSVDCNVNSLIMRNFNQLDFLFSSIKSHGVRNINLNCNQFINAYKTLVINNCNSVHSSRENCEKDYNKIMQSLKHVINKPIKNCNVKFEYDVDYLLMMMESIKNNDSILHNESKNYITRYVIKKARTKIFKNCYVCYTNLCRQDVDLKIKTYIYEIDYTKKSLFHPNDDFVSLMNEIYFIIVAFLRECPESKSFKSRLKFYIDCACDFRPITCSKHRSDLINYISNLTINLILYSWCKGVNGLINGKYTEFDRNDKIKQQAYGISKTKMETI